MAVIALDVDDVCAVLSDPWCDAYNEEYHDSLTPDQITDWNMTQFVKPECGVNIFKYIEDPTIYDKVVPVEDALWGVNELRKMGHRVIFITSSTIGAAGRKFTWLKDHGFITDKRDYVEATDKNLIICDVLLDDNFENYERAWKRGVYAYLFTRPWNKKFFTYDRISSWKEFISEMQKLEVDN